MRDDLSYAGATASFIASLSMALLAAVALANAGGSAWDVRQTFGVLVAIAATSLSVLFLRASVNRLNSHRKAASRKLAPVPIQTKERVRARR